MKKICFFSNSLFDLNHIGGEQKVTSKLANLLVNNGYDVTIIIKNKEKVNSKFINLDKKVKVIFLNCTYDFRLNNIKLFEKLRIINRKNGLLKNSPKIIRHFFVSNKMLYKLKHIFMNNDFDYVIGISGDRSFMISYLKKYIKGKIIYWNHSSFYAHYKKENSRYYNEENFIKPLIKKFDEIILLTDNDKDLFKKYYNVNAKVIPNFKTFNSDIKTSLDNKRFLAVGRLDKAKGFDKLIEIMSLFCKNNNDWNLDIYGNGNEKNNLQKQIDSKNLNDRIKIYDSVSNIKDIYLKHDIYLMTSVYEGFPLVLLEALECGLPVISYKIPNIDKIINNKNGKLVKNNDINEFVNILNDFTNNKKLLKKLQKNIPNTIKKYDENEILNIWKNIFED